MQRSFVLSSSMFALLCRSSCAGAAGGADPGGCSNPNIPFVSSFALQLPGLLTEFCTAPILNQVPLDFPEWVPCQSWVQWGGCPLKKDSIPINTYKKRVSQDLLLGQAMTNDESGQRRWTSSELIFPNPLLKMRPELLFLIAGMGIGILWICHSCHSLGWLWLICCHSVSMVVSKWSESLSSSFYHYQFLIITISQTCWVHLWLWICHTTNQEIQQFITQSIKLLNIWIIYSNHQIS